MRIKLPRKRKKAYIKARGLVDYIAAKIIEEILFEGRPGHKPRFVKGWKGFEWDKKPASYW